MRTKIDTARFFAPINLTLLTLLAVICIAPLLHILALSFSSSSEILSGHVTLFPREFNTAAYKEVFKDASLFRSLVFTITLTITFTALCMLMTILAAYPLTKRNLKGRKFFLYIIIPTMYFGGGIIPEYLLVKGLHMLDTMWALILPSLISPFYMIILMSFIRSIPQGLEEAAEIDGASAFHMLVRIILPLTVPAIVTLSLFYAVSRWNGFTDSLFYISKPDMYPLQLKLYQIVSNVTSIDQNMAERFNEMQAPLLPESTKAAAIIFAIFPIVIVYPWLQKYFISGTMLGSVKE
ncbi:carbohydrate ABC transporter permease [Paenibacillus oryzisoli]|uniref:carbohydrate ABC transporter permease n=1 Tax=Paenibacillus oryzisoli TaxID=1850517 RepID=UPI003D2C5923